MSPETLWLRQAPCPDFNNTTLDIPVNANLRKNFNQDQTLFPITIYYLICSEHDDYCVLWIPLIEQYIQVKLSNRFKIQQELLHDEIKKALYGYTKGDWQSVLFEAQRVTSFDVKQFTFTVEAPTIAEQLQFDSTKGKISPSDIGLKKNSKYFFSSLPPIINLEDQAERMDEDLIQEQPISVLIVGEPGVGKTSLWNLFSQKHIKDDYSCYYTTPTLLAANFSEEGFLPDANLERIVQFAKTNKGVYYLGNLWELAQVGMYYKHPISIADYLIPYLEKKELGVVVECNNEQFADLEKTKPELIQMFDIIKLEPANAGMTADILREYADNYSSISISSTAISAITELYKRYSVYESLPGAAVKFLDLLLSKNINVGNRVIDKSDVIDFFTLQTGLPNFLLDPAIPFNKSEAKKFFTSRVIGQDGASDKGAKGDNDINAVDTVVELLETVKSGLARQTGPIATLLFIGPTGVGKTEMAKALAEYLYSDPKRMIRLDMSEFADATSADRLINGLNGGEGVLTSQVRAQPFGVVLLDEFEKADPSVFDMFLQVMGEGRLTDAQGRLADFTNCVIILTSNLGVDTFGKSSLVMQQSQKDSSQEHFTESVAKLVRPELLNRIDRIVPFRPLSKSVLRQILNLEFQSVNRRLGIQWRHLNISYDNSVIDKLVELGYSPRFGARPLRRTVEMYILHPLAEAMAKRNANLVYDVHFSLPENLIHASADSVKPERLFKISVKPRSQDSDSDIPSVSSKQTTELLQKYRSIVQSVNSVYNCEYIEGLQSEALYIEQLLQSDNQDANRVDSKQMIMKHNTCKDFLNRLYLIRKKAFGLESDVVFDFLTSKERFSQGVSKSSSSDNKLVQAEKEWISLLNDLFSFKHELKKSSSYIAYISGNNPSVLLFFDLLFKALIPNESLKESCLLNRNASKIQMYLDKYCSGVSTYHWIDADGVIHREYSKKAFQKILQTSPPHSNQENKSRRRESKQRSSTPSFEYLIQDFNPDIMEDIFMEDAPAAGCNTLVLETSDQNSIMLLKALEGFHSLKVTETTEKSSEKSGKTSSKKNNRELCAYIEAFPREQCLNELPEGVRRIKPDGNDSGFQYRFTSSSLPKEYSAGKTFTFSRQTEQSSRISFETDSLNSCFSAFVVKFMCNDLLERNK
ncbi:MAG: ATP-dependent Clp protease ATP-binding subunit [Thermoguttaceae bacterium]|nr:ATP-dependent Clp protease ATP-binding subunit [Thermoguttaceae bacterium]